MDGILRLSAKERKTCLKTYRAASTARRALVLLLLAEGRSYRQIAAATLASPTLIRAVKKDWQAGGVARVVGTEEQPFAVAWWLIVVVRWLLHKTPQDFGFFRTRWSCALLASLLWEQEGLRLSAASSGWYFDNCPRNATCPSKLKSIAGNHGGEVIGLP